MDIRMSGMKVRQATLSDIEAFRKFILEAWRQAGPDVLGWTGASEEAVAKIASREYLASLFSRPDTKVFLAVIGRRVVGFASNSRVDEETIELSGIVVLESMTGRAIGSRLLKASICAALSDGFSRILVRTETFNDRAIAFYNRKGFKAAAQRTISVEGVNVEVVELVLRLDRNQHSAFSIEVNLIGETVIGEGSQQQLRRSRFS